MKCNPEEPIPTSQPNKGSVQGRKEKKRIKQRKDFIMVNAPSILYTSFYYCNNDKLHLDALLHILL